MLCELQMGRDWGRSRRAINRCQPSHMPTYRRRKAGAAAATELLLPLRPPPANSRRKSAAEPCAVLRMFGAWVMLLVWSVCVPVCVFCGRGLASGIGVIQGGIGWSQQSFKC